jgi:release factor glutamine methyltransferase
LREEGGVPAISERQAEGARIGALAAWGRSRLNHQSSSAGLDAERLLAHCAGIARSVVIAFPERELPADAAACYRAAIERRASGEPLAYITGVREFYSLPLQISADVLVPRPETELLVDAALKCLKDASPQAAALELGTGSGAVAIALQRTLPALRLTAVDVDSKALAIAAANAKRLGCPIRFLISDWFQALGAETFDLVVANPPYVASGDAHFDSALGFEPRLALDGGKDGLEAYRQILAAAADHLSPQACVVFEHGYDQRERLAALATARGYEPIWMLDDLSGQPRVMGLRLHSTGSHG